MDWSVLWDLGVQALPLIASGVMWLMGKFVYSRIGHEYTREALGRATQEIFSAVEEVGQTYVKQIKKGQEEYSSGGKLLTDAEKENAKRMAIENAKANLGKKGLTRLVKVLGGPHVAESWFETKVESAVSSLKRAEKAVETTTTPANPQ